VTREIIITITIIIIIIIIITLNVIILYLHWLKIIINLPHRMYLRIYCGFGINRGVSLHKVKSLFFVTERTFFVRDRNSVFLQ
jgi:hypothetical protein